MPQPKMHRARKRFGQNFLVDTQVLSDIIDSLGLQPNDRVVEIGPGLGALTTHLYHSLNHLYAIEIDRDLIAHLTNQFAAEKFTLFNQDVLEFDFSKLSKNPSDLRVVGNLPYNISSPLLFHLFETIQCIKDMHFMLQKEVAERLSATIGTKNYGRLSVMAQYFCDTEYLFTVPPTAFDPAPKVESAIIRLTPKKSISTPCLNYALLSKVVKEAFTYRRKTLSNSLKKMLSSTEIEQLKINPGSRPEKISVDEFVSIANYLQAMGPLSNCDKT